MVSVAFSSHNDALGVQTMPQNFTYLFQLCIKTFLQTWNAPYVCALTFEKMAEIACKTRHFDFVSAKHFNVWRTQQVGSAHFFTFQDDILGPIRVNIKHSKVELGPFEKITFFPPDPLIMCNTSLLITMTRVLEPDAILDLQIGYLSQCWRCYPYQRIG